MLITLNLDGGTYCLFLNNFIRFKPIGGTGKVHVFASNIGGFFWEVCDDMFNRCYLHSELLDILID